MRLQEIIKIIFIALFYSLTARYIFINVPGTEIPVTGQSLVIFLFSYIFPERVAYGAILLYLIAGLIGIPVFAEGGSGWMKFVGPGGGYLYGFLISTALIQELKKDDGYGSGLHVIQTMFWATIVLLIFGVIHLASQKGFALAVSKGFLPFIPGALIKIIFGSALAFVACLFKKNRPFNV